MHDRNVFEFCGCSHFDKYLWPVLILLVCCHQQIACQNRDQAVAFCFKVDRSIPTQEAAQGLVTQV